MGNESWDNSRGALTDLQDLIVLAATAVTHDANKRMYDRTRELTDRWGHPHLVESLVSLILGHVMALRVTRPAADSDALINSGLQMGDAFQAGDDPTREYLLAAQANMCELPAVPSHPKTAERLVIGLALVLAAFMISTLAQLDAL